MTRPILILGATGVFGRRLAAHLAREPGLRLLVSSRSLDRAARLAADLAGRPETTAALEPVAVDVNHEPGNVFASCKPGLVIDCSGPFQAMDYRVALAAGAAGAHFIDLADARGYLTGFSSALDEAFRSRGLVALAGASSSPALAAAVVAELSAGWQALRDIDIAIVPGGRSEVGEAAVAAALSYCGRPVPVVRDGMLTTTTGWGEARDIEIEGLGRRRVSPVETSDAELLGKIYPQARSIRFRAGLGSGLENAGLRMIASLKRRGLLDFLGPLEAYAPLFTRMRQVTRVTTGDVGGMIVRVSGTDGEGDDVLAEWRLIARNNEGPHVPPSPAAAAARAVLAGHVVPGARPALDLTLADIETEFSPYAIETARDVRKVPGAG